MENQMWSTLRVISVWSADKHELSGPPVKIKCAGESDLHGYHYYILKYKKNLFGKWPLGVCDGYEIGETEHYGRVFSAMETYDAKIILEESIRMVETIRACRMQWVREERQKQQTAPPYESEETPPEQEQRKARSISVLKEKGVPYIEHLPVIESATTPYTSQEVARRAIACLTTIQVACDMSRGENVEKSQELFQQMLEVYEVAGELTPKEQMFFSGRPSNQDAVNMAWKYEVYWPLIRTLGLVDNLEYPDQIYDYDFAIEAVSSCGSSEESVESTWPREISEILDGVDLILRYDWVYVNVRLRGREVPAELDSSAVVERRWGLN